MSKKDKSSFSHFFKENDETVQSILKGTEKEISQTVGLATKEEFPTLGTPIDLSDPERRAKWLELRSFFRKGNNDAGLPADFSPLILAPLYSKSFVAADYPVWVNSEIVGDVALKCVPLKELIIDAFKKFAPKETDALILKENIEIIIHVASGQLTGHMPQPFVSIIDKILKEVDRQLEVTGDEDIVFKANLEQLKSTLPDHGLLLPYSNNASFHLLDAAMLSSVYYARLQLKKDIKEHINKLNDLLRVEKEKDPSNLKSEESQSSYDFASSVVNFDKISEISPDSGTVHMSAVRKNRILEVIKTLENSASLFDKKGFLFVDQLVFNNRNLDWDSLFQNTTIETYETGNGCDAINDGFNSSIQAWTTLFLALRVAELELESQYKETVHDDYFKYFNWENFSHHELICCPHYFLISDDIHLFNTEFSKLSALLSSNIPVKILAVKRDEPPQKQKNKGESRAMHTQTELGALMLTHKNIYVNQSTSITPTYLYDAIVEGLNAFAPAFFYILDADPDVHDNPYLWTSAAIEGRDFPGFTYKGLLGTTWGSRFNIQNNPQSTSSWPLHPLTVVNEEGEKIEMEFPYTYADHLVLNEFNHAHYKIADRGCWDENLIPIDRYMANTTEANIGKVPFIWMTDQFNALSKIAVSWQVVLATQERLDFWKFLQENSGINNYHVTKAIKNLRAQLEIEYAQKIDAIQETFDQKLIKVQDEEAEKVMENLTSVLLGLDLNNMNTSMVSKPMANAPSFKTTENVAPALKVKEEKEEEQLEEELEDNLVLTNDPYIDTALCTSCNECTQKNGVMFKYNADKMAYIADPKAGSFLELIEAAELCPVGIIHPGAPLNSEEANVEELIKRAAKFNG